MTLQARYTILRKIADGGTAEIFLATQHGAHGFEKPVVLKRIFPAFYADPQFRNMLVDEAHIAMSLNHSNIVQVLDLGEAQGQYVLALELVDGWSLDAVLRRARALNTALPPALALYTAAEVCRALAYAHAKTGSDGLPLGIVHRDASPHNVLLSEQGEVKLTDFGIAKAQNRREISLGNIIKGKIAYMSPEQASGGELDWRSDLFSVGTMLYVMICGRYPFDAPTDLEVLLLVKAGDYVAPETARPGLNPEIYRVLKRAMAKEPGDRYQRADEMLVDFEQVMRVAFRPVGQTELKRWLQDLSMRDGVPPLTQAPPPASNTAGIAGRTDGDVIELQGIGETPGPTLPPPSTVPRPSRPMPSVGSGPLGKMKPPPPPAAMLVGKKSTSSSTHAIPTLPTAPAPRSGPLAVPAVVPGASPSLTPLPTPTPTDQQLSVVALPTPGPVPHTDRPSLEEDSPQSLLSSSIVADGADDQVAIGAEAAPTDATESAIESHHGDKASPDELAGIARADRHSGRISALDPPVPAPPRKSSSWVAEAVAASAQRAGTAPAPPMGPVVPPPPVTLAAPAEVPEAASAPSPSATADQPSPRRWVTRAALGIAAVLVVGFSLKVCGGQANVRRGKRPPQVAVSGTSRDTTNGSKVAISGAANSQPTPASPDPAAVASDATAVGTTVAGSGGSAGGATVAANTTPPATALGNGQPNDISPSGATAPPVSAGSAADGGTAGERGDSEPDGGTDPDEAAARVPRVMVLLKSNPPGAQVGTAHRAFGATPVSARLKVGRTYALTFTREGYRPVTKSFRVTNFSDQQVTAMLRKTVPGPPTTADQPPSPAPAKPSERTWFQRMFGR